MVDKDLLLHMADIKFNSYCNNLDKILVSAFNRTMSKEKRLCQDTKTRIFNEYTKELKAEINEYLSKVKE